MGRLLQCIEDATRPGPRSFAVDGGGAGRVASRIAESLVTTSGVRLRPATWQDWALLLEWANDETTRQASFHPDTIGEREHLSWFEATLLDPGSRIWIAEDGTRAVGTLRLEKDGEEVIVSITVAPSLRGRGWGRKMLASLSVWTQSTKFTNRLVAWVRQDNPSSISLFTRTGYRVVSQAEVNTHKACRLEWEP
jgi:ribosomal protein S18 acetylase RimI-like enzyme